MILVRGDYSQIEARVIAWLAGAEWKLAAFRKADRGEGPDLYIVGATGIYQVRPGEITKKDPRRQVGKVSELALGFQGGVNALQAMCRGYGLKIPLHPRKPDGQPDREIEPDTGTDLWIVNRWRQANPELSDRDDGLWATLERAATECVMQPAGREFFAASGKIRFKRTKKAMAMRLPSGRSVLYWHPAIKVRKTSWGQDKSVVTFRAEDTQTHWWKEFVAYGGQLAQHATQATARDVARNGLLNIDDDPDFWPVLTVHDEVIAECDVTDTPENREWATATLCAHMENQPACFAGLPVVADGSAGPRYMKDD